MTGAASGLVATRAAAAALIATDLDRTLIYSRHAMGERQFADLAPVCVEMYQDAPLSYLSSRAVELLVALAAAAPVVPVTTRTATQYHRITLPGGPFRYAVVSSGGRILHDGRDDARWRAQVEHGVAQHSAPLAEIVGRLESIATQEWVHTLRTADELFCYLVVDLDAQPAEFLAEWEQWCEPRGWVVSQQGRKIYALPRTVTKSAALAEVRRRLIAAGEVAADAPVCAAGDGRLDTDMLVYANRAIRPRHGELETIGWRPPGVSVTTATGAAAGEEILLWFHRQIHRDPRPTAVGEGCAAADGRIE